MKHKILVLLLVLGMVVLAGCGQNAPKTDAQAHVQSAESEAASQADTKPEEAVTEETYPSETYDTEPEPAGTLVVYFSATGHTKPLAEYAAEHLVADIFEIIPEIPYTDADLNYNNSSSRSTREQNDASARPAIAGELPDLSGYDTIIIGHPIWWGQAPKIIYTFLESYDWSGKTLVTFCTSASSGLGSSAENLKSAAAGNPAWLESRRFSISAEKDEVIDWLTACGLQPEHKDESEGMDPSMQMKIGDSVVSVDWESNESVEALQALCQDGPLTVQLSMYGGFEQVGSIGQSLPRSDVPTTTQAGDIVLYSGNQIVVFYGSNSWAYTRLGHITDRSEQEMAQLLGSGNVTITIGVQ